MIWRSRRLSSEISSSGSGIVTPWVDMASLLRLQLAEGPCGLAAHFGVRVLERLRERAGGPRVGDLAERPGGLLAHLGVLVAQRPHERLDGLGALDLAERPR